jgi:hypothetical protein
MLTNGRTGQWGNIVGTLLAVVGSLYAVLAKDITRWLRGEAVSHSGSDDGCTCTCSRHDGSQHPPYYGPAWPGPTFLDATSIATDEVDHLQRPSQDTGPFPRLTLSEGGHRDGHRDFVLTPRLPQPANHPGYLVKGSRGQAYRLLTAVSRFLGTAQDPNGGYFDKEKAQYPEIPGEHVRNARLRQTRHTWRTKVELSSRSPSRNRSAGSGSPVDDEPRTALSGSPRESDLGVSMSGATGGAASEMHRQASSRSMPAGAGHLRVPERALRRSARRSTTPSGLRPGIVLLDAVPARRRPSRPPAIAITQADTAAGSPMESPGDLAGPASA